MVSATPLAGAGGEARPALAVRPHRRRDGEHGERDLHVVMIDAAGRELLIRRHAGHREQQRDQSPPRVRRSARRSPPCRPWWASSQSNGHHARISRSASCASANGWNTTSKPASPGIDQPRPVHVDAERRLHARLMHVEPAAEQAGAIEPGAQLHEPHRVVGVEQRLGGLRPVLQQQRERDHEPHQHQERGEIRLAQQIAGHGTACLGMKRQCAL